MRMKTRAGPVMRVTFLKCIVSHAIIVARLTTRYPSGNQYEAKVEYQHILLDPLRRP